MKRAIAVLPDWKHPILDGEKVDIHEVVHILVTGNEYIPANAFSSLPNLKSVVIADDVKGIFRDTFRNCDNLEFVKFGSGIEFIGEAAFLSNDKIEEIVIPGNIKTIRAFAFHSMHNLKALTIEEGVESIETWAFENCTNLEKINFPHNSIQKVGRRIFSDSKWLKSQKDDFVMICGILICYQGNETEHLKIPDNVTDIVPGAFKKAVKEVEFGKGMKKIPDYVFEGYKSLERIVLPEGIEEIGYMAFHDCTNLKDVIAPDSLIRVNLSSLSVTNVKDCPPRGPVYLGRVFLGFVGGTKRIMIKEGTYSISPMAFMNCNRLETIVFPTSIRELGESIKDCRNLYSVVIPKGVPASCLQVFVDMEGFKIFTWEGSEAEVFAQEKGIPFECLEENLSEEEIIKRVSKKIEYKKSDGSSSHVSSPTEWFRRVGNTLAGISREGIKKIRSEHIVSLTLPVEKDGYKLERLAPECLSILEEVPEVQELIIPEGLEIPGVTTTSGRIYWHFPNCSTIKKLVFAGKTAINFSMSESMMFADSLESIKIQKSDAYKSVDGVIYSKDGCSLVYYPRSRKGKVYKVLPGTKRIYNRAFNDVKVLEELIINDEVKSIYWISFKRSSIRRLSVPAGIGMDQQRIHEGCQLEIVEREKD